MTFHDEGVNRRCGGSGSHEWLAEYVNRKRIPYHLLWCPWCGDFVQMVPFDKAARSMRGGSVDQRQLSANRSGAVNIQVCVVGHGPGRPVTDSPMKNAAVLGRLADSWDIPHTLRLRWGPQAGRSVRAWSLGGIQGHCHGPHDDHTDPGKINRKKLRKALWP